MARRRSVHIDDSELADLQVDMRGAPARVTKLGRQRLRQAAKLVEVGMKRDFAGHRGTWFHKSRPHREIAAVERYVSSELVGPLTAEIGVEHRRAGKLALVLSRPVPLNPVPTVDHTAALRRSEPAIVELFGDVVEDAPLGEGGGR